MDSNQPAKNSEEYQPQERLLGKPHAAVPAQHDPVQTASSNPYASPLPDHMVSHEPSHDVSHTNEFGPTRSNDPFSQESKHLSKKWQQRLYWSASISPLLSLWFANATCRLVPLCILAIVLVVLFEVYKSDFERWVSPLTDWLRKREAWSWVIPVLILFILSFPPLFGHEIVQLVVGVSLQIDSRVRIDFINIVDS
jgi:hypothetical protein